MRAHRHALSCALAVCALTLLGADIAAAQGIRLDDPELTRVSQVVITGRVTGISAARDAATGYIYSYVRVSVDERIKGRVPIDEIIVKQLGGRDGDVEMVVYDQAVFAVGEEVLLFLAERPRDRTLQTTGLWQGKWTIERDAAGAGVVSRSPLRARDLANLQPEARVAARSTYDDVRLLRPFVAELRAWSGERPRRGAGGNLDLQPAGAPPPGLDSTGAIGVDTEFVFLGCTDGTDNNCDGGTPARFHEADNGMAVRVDMQSNGEPGLIGGGFSQVATARGLWNAAGSSLTLAQGNNNKLAGMSMQQVCDDTDIADGRITLYFNDPCREIADNTSTLAVGGFFSSGLTIKTVKGNRFFKITKGFVVAQDAPSAQMWLDNPRCFQDLMTHEIGHTIGIGHTGVPGNIMQPNLDGACLSAAAAVQGAAAAPPEQGPITAPITGGIGNDDRAAIQAIYPGAPPPPTGDGLPGAPRSLSFTLSEDRVILDWLPPNTGGAVSSYQIQGGSGPGRNNLVNFDTFQNATRINLKIGEGTYFIRVRARNPLGLSTGSSNEVNIVVTGTPSVPNPVFVAPTINLTQNAAGNAVVLGELQNRVVGASATMIRVEARFLRANSSEIGTRSAFIQGRSRRLRASGVVTNTALLPGQRGCFMITTNIPAAQVAQVELGGTFSTADHDALLGRLRIGQIGRQEDGAGNLEMVGTASNVGSRTTFFNKIVVDVKTPLVQSCGASFIDGSTVPVPGGGTTPTGLAPNQVGTFTHPTGVPFAPIEVRTYTQWDEAAAGTTNALARLRTTDADVATSFAHYDAARTRWRQSVTGSSSPETLLRQELRTALEARLLELEERLAPGAARAPILERVVVPMRIGSGGRE